jgi:hypothetical protein
MTQSIGDDFNVREDADDEISDVARLANLHEDEMIGDETVDDENTLGTDEGYEDIPI